VSNLLEDGDPAVRRRQSRDSDLDRGVQVGVERDTERALDDVRRRAVRQKLEQREERVSAEGHVEPSKEIGAGIVRAREVGVHDVALRPLEADRQIASVERERHAGGILVVAYRDLQRDRGHGDRAGERYFGQRGSRTDQSDTVEAELGLQRLRIEGRILQVADVGLERTGEARCARLQRRQPCRRQVAPLQGDLGAVDAQRVLERRYERVQKRARGQRHQQGGERGGLDPTSIHGDSSGQARKTRSTTENVPGSTGRV